MPLSELDKSRVLNGKDLNRIGDIPVREVARLFLLRNVLYYRFSIHYEPHELERVEEGKKAATRPDLLIIDEVKNQRTYLEVTTNECRTEMVEGEPVRVDPKARQRWVMESYPEVRYVVWYWPHLQAVQKANSYLSLPKKRKTA